MLYNFLSSYDITKYVAACASKAGVSVVWEDPDKCTPRTSGRTIYLPRLRSDASVDDITRLKQFVKHETSHIKYSDFSVLEQVKDDSLLVFLCNIIEDHRIDYLNDRDFAGDRNNTDAYNLLFMKKGISHTPADLRSMLCPMFSWEAHGREDLWPVSMVDFFKAATPKDGEEKYKKLMAGDYLEVLRNIREDANPKTGTQACMELAKRILKEVYEQDPEEHMQPPPSPEPEKGEGKGEGGEGQGSGEGEEEGEGEGEAQAAEMGEGDGEGKPRKALMTVDGKGKELMPTPVHTGAKGEGVNLSNYTMAGDGYTPTPANLVLEFNHETGTHPPELDPTPYPPYIRSINNVANGSESMSNVLRTKLQVFSRDRMEYGKKKGKLQTSALWKMGVPNSAIQERIFKRRIENDTLDVCVQILIDCSGSMSGSKFEHAAGAVVLLNEVLSNVLKVPVEVLGYTEMWTNTRDYSKDTERNTMHIFQSFGKRTQAPTMISRLAVAGNNLSNNADGEAFMYGYNRIQGRKEKRKIMIVLSDGSPAGGGGKGSISTFTKEVIQRIEKSPVELVGVGVLYDGVKHWYKNNATIAHANEVEATLIQLIDRLILR